LKRQRADPNSKIKPSCGWRGAGWRRWRVTDSEAGCTDNSEELSYGRRGSRWDMAKGRRKERNEKNMDMNKA
jgi:hypothetical protein